MSVKIKRYEQAESPFCTVGEVAKKLHLGRPAVFKLIEEGSLRIQKVGNRTYIFRNSLQTFLEGGCVQ